MHFHQYKKFYDKSIGYFGKFANAPKNDVIATLLELANVGFVWNTLYVL